MAIEFKQYMRPHGNTRIVNILRSDDIEIKAKEVKSKGFVFENEVLNNGLISMSITKYRPPPPFEDELLAMKICENGPEVLPTVDELVIEAHRKLNAKSNIGYQSPS